MRIPLDIPPGLNADDTAYASAPAWADMDNYRFRLGRPQMCGGWESLIIDEVGGVCRAVLPWSDTSNVLNIAFGTHQTLEVYQGGMLYDITPSSGFTAGQIDGTGTSGFGTGAYGSGTYGSPSSTDYFPLTWDLAPLGQNLIACPRNQTLFRWQNNTGTVAAALTNAPARVTAMVVARDFVFALGCNEEVSGTFNPLCIRHSDVRGPTGWSTDATSASTSREYVLPGGGRIVGGQEISRSLLVWTDHSLWLGTYVGQLNKVWLFERVGANCGLIGPKAKAVFGSTAIWFSPDRQFHSYTLGGAVQVVPCPIREDMADNLAASQADKIIGSTISEHGEVRFDYPDRRDGYENSRYVALTVQGPDAGTWRRGYTGSRTAMVDAGPTAHPVGVSYAGRPYWHESGDSADGAALSAFIETADIYLDEEREALIKGMWPDVADQAGPLTVSFTTRRYPQGDATTWEDVVLTPGQDRADFKITGRLIRVRFTANSSPAYNRLGRITFEVKLRGRL